MALRRIGDLDVALHGGTVFVRAPGRGFGARVPAAAVAILAFCDAPRTRDEVVGTFGPPGGQLYDALAGAGFLEDPATADATPVFFQNFASLDTHRRMLGDRVRLEAYADALREVVRPEHTVVDAGTGSGVLAMLAARAGARQVFGVDNAEILEQARAVVDANGLADTVALVPGDFRTVALPSPVQVLVTETFGALAYAEGAAPDLRACLAANGPDATVIPASVELWCAPVGPALAAEIAEGYGDWGGLTFAPLAEAARHRGVTWEIPVSALLAEPVRLTAAPWPGFTDRHTGSARFGVDPRAVGGLAAWFDLQMSPSVRLSTGPSAPLTHWKQVFLPLPALGGVALELELAFAPPANDRRGLEVQGTANGAPVFWRVR